MVSLGSGGLAFAYAACPSLGESRPLPGGSASSFWPLCQIWGWSSRDVSLAVRVSITGSSVVMGSSLGLRHSSSLPVVEACASSGMGFRAPESLKGSFAGVGSELARGRSSAEKVMSGREALLRGRDQDRGTVAFSGEGGRGLGRSEDLVPAATGWQSWFRSRAMVLAFTRIELRDPCWDRAHLAVFPVILSWV